MKEIMDRKGLLFVINALEPGGAEMFMVRLAVYLQEHFDIHILSLLPERDDPAFIAMMRERFEFQLMPRNPQPTAAWQDWLHWKLNAVAYHFGKPGLHAQLAQQRRDAHLVRELKRRNIIAINSSSSTSDHFAVHRLKRLSGIPVLITMHSSYNHEVWPTDDMERRDFFALAKSIFDHADSILYTADRNIEIFEKFSDYRGPRPEKQYMGYQAPETYADIRENFGIDRSSFLISMVARGAREKGWVEAIDAFRRLRAMHQNTWLVLVCPITEHIAELQARVSVDEHIIFTGYVGNPADIMWSSDCTILPSHYPESLPYSIIESLGAGRPVFATPIAEIPQMLETAHGMAGGIIPLRDGKADPSVLAEQLLRAATDAEHLRQMRMLAGQAFNKFSMAHCGDRYRNVFNKLMHGK